MSTIVSQAFETPKANNIENIEKCNNLIGNLEHLCIDLIQNIRDQ